MNLLELPPAVQKLATVGESWEKQPQWRDYRAFGIEPDDIPALIVVVEHAEDFWVDNDSPESWMPIHAWRALGQLQASEAMPALVRTLPWIDESDNDVVQEDMPNVFGLIGPAAVPGLVGFLADAGHPIWSRIAAAEGLKNVAVQHPAARGVVVDALLRALEDYPVNGYPLNSFLILYLSYLNATEGALLIQRVFASGRVDEDVTGDWEDYQVAVGLLGQRLTPRGDDHLSPTAFLDGLPSAAVGSLLEQAQGTAQAAQGTAQAAQGTAEAEMPNVEKKKKTAHAQHKHPEKANKEKESAKQKRKEAKLKRKKGKKK